MVSPGNRGVLFSATGTKNSEKKDQEGIIYLDTMSQDSTNVLNSNEKIPVRLWGQGSLIHLYDFPLHRPIQWPQVLSFQESLLEVLAQLLL